MNREQIKQKLNAVKTAMISMQKMGEETGKIDLSQAQIYYEHVNKERHDILLFLVQEKIGVESGYGDMNPKEIAIREAAEHMSPAYRQDLITKFQDSHWRNYNKTPDIVKFKWSGESGDPNDTNQTILEAEYWDIAVTVDYQMAVNSKEKKYKPLLDLIEDARSIVGVIYYNITTEDVGYHSIPERVGVDINNDEMMNDFREMVKETEEFKRWIRSSLEKNDLEVFSEWVRNKGIDGELLNTKLEQMSFGITLEELKKIIRESKPANQYFRDLDYNSRVLMVNTLIRTGQGENDASDIGEFAGFLRVKNEDIVDGQAGDEFFNRLEMDVFLEMMNYKAEKLPREPSHAELENSFWELEEKAKASFELLEGTKLLNPFPLNFSFSSDISKESKGAAIKKKRLERLNSWLEEVQNPDDTIKALKLLTSPATIPDKKYFEEFMKGSIYLLDNGGTITKEEFIKEAREFSRNSRDSIIKGQFDPTTTELKNNKKIVAVSYKKGEVIQVRPSYIREIKDLLSTAGVGKKYLMAKDDKRYKTKVKSMPFWDEEKTEEDLALFEELIMVFERRLTEIGKAISEDYFKAIKSDATTSSESGSDESGSTGADSSLYSDDEDLHNFEKGVRYYLRHNEILWENLSFVSHLGGAGFRIVQGITDNTFILVFPTESIMKGHTGVPYITISLKDKNDIHMNFLDRNSKEYFLPGRRMLVVSMGRRIDRPRLDGYLKIRPMFYTALSIINQMRNDSGSGQLNSADQSLLLMIINNININTSSLIDNVRYMVENTMAEYSFCSEFITDKFLVPSKNLVQLYLYTRSKNLLKNLRSEMEKVRVKRAEQDSEGNVSTDMTRVIAGEFSSLIFQEGKYKKPEHLISEIYTLFFSIPKGLHGNFHVMLEIHKTPLEIQDDINRKHEGKVPHRYGTPKSRYEYDPRFLVLGAMEMTKNMNMTSNQVRDNFIRREKPDETPLRSKTTSSTRSTLVEVESNELRLGRGSVDIESNPMLSDVSLEGFEKLHLEISRLHHSIENKKPFQAKKIFKKWKEGLTENKWEKVSDAGFQQIKGFIGGAIRLNTDVNMLEYRAMSSKNDYRKKVVEIINENRIDKIRTSGTRFYSSGIVLSEVLTDIIVNEKGEAEQDDDGVFRFESISKKAKDAVTQSKDWVFGIRKKGQRTQKDREIFVVSLDAKLGMYILEHFYKQMCMSVHEEKISETGDLKIVSMERQVRSGFEWIARTQKSLPYEEREKMTADCFHFNLDMTKWAPKDNVFKFIYTIAGSSEMTVREKFYMLGVLFKIASKKMYLDEELFVKVYESRKHDLVNQTGEELKEDIIEKMTNGFKRNMIPIVETWLQGQLNYLSSWTHTGAIFMWKKYLGKLHGADSKMRFFINVHSDDEQSSVYMVRDKGVKEYNLIRDMWRVLEFVMKSSCIELSTKKSNISKLIKQFVSQYNIAGEQIYLWCKPLMAAISGCPYTTLKDDMSSLMSKVSEALSKGAPKSVSNIVIDEMKLHLWALYGIRTKEMKNLFAKELGLEEKFLPSCLGGHFVHDYMTLSIAGPRSQDQMIISELIRLCGGSVSNKIEKISGDQRVQRALSVFYILDLLQSETITEEEDQSASTTLNPFKPSRFKTKRGLNSDPFSKLFRGTREEIVKKIKEKSPGLGLLKPIDAKDLMKYFLLMYSNSNFKASLAGQSPAVLHIHKIVNRKTGIFRIKDSGDITLEKYKEHLGKTSFTAKEVADFLNGMVESLKLKPNHVEYLRVKYMSNDPEFRVLEFVKQHAAKSVVVVKKNPIPRRKPLATDYSPIINNIPTLLCYFFDSEYFLRNKFKIQYPEALPNDLVRLSEMFPVEFSWLREKIREEDEITNEYYREKMDNSGKSEANGKKPTNRYPHYRQVLLLIRRADRASGNEGVTRLKELDRTVKTDRDLIDMVRESEMIAKTGVGRGAALDPEESITQIDRTDAFDIYSRLVSSSKLIESKTQKVIFCAPSRTNELHEIALAMKTTIESSGEFAMSYYLDALQQKAVREIRNILHSGSFDADKLDFIIQLSNLIELMKRIKAEYSQMLEVVKKSELRGVTIGDIRKIYNNLPRRFRSGIFIPLSMMNPSMITDLLRKLDPLHVEWVEAEEFDTGKFAARVFYENMVIFAEGERKKIKSLEINYYNELKIFLLDIAIKSLISDLVYSTPYRIHEVVMMHNLELTKAYETTESMKKKFGVSTITNSIVQGNDPTCTHYIEGISLKKNETPRINKNYQEIVFNQQKLEVEYSIEGSRVMSIGHRYFKKEQITDIKIPDMVVSGFELREIASKRIYVSLMTRKIIDTTIDEVVKYHTSPETIIENESTASSQFCYALGTSQSMKNYGEMQSIRDVFLLFIREMNQEINKFSSGEIDLLDYGITKRKPGKSKILESEDMKCAIRDKYIDDQRELLAPNENWKLFDDWFCDMIKDSNGKEAADKLHLKTEMWGHIMQRVSTMNLRSIQVAIHYIRSNQIKEELYANDSVKFPDQMNSINIFQEMAEAKLANESLLDSSLLSTLMDNSQLYQFTQEDVVMFGTMCEGLAEIYLDTEEYINIRGKSKKKIQGAQKGKHRMSTFLKMFWKEMNDDKKSVSKKNRKFWAICCIHMGHKFTQEYCVNFLTDINQRSKVMEAVDFFDTNRKLLSDYLVPIGLIFRQTWEAFIKLEQKLTSTGKSSYSKGIDSSRNRFSINQGPTELTSSVVRKKSINKVPVSSVKIRTDPLLRKAAKLDPDTARGSSASIDNYQKIIHDTKEMETPAEDSYGTGSESEVDLFLRRAVIEKKNGKTLRNTIIDASKLLAQDRIDITEGFLEEVKKSKEQIKSLAKITEIEDPLIEDEAAIKIAKAKVYTLTSGRSVVPDKIDPDDIVVIAAREGGNQEEDGDSDQNFDDDYFNQDFD